MSTGVRNRLDRLTDLAKFSLVAGREDSGPAMTPYCEGSGECDLSSALGDGDGFTSE